MARRSLVILTLAGLLVTVSETSMAVQPNSVAGPTASTRTNSYTQAEERQAQEAARRAGYTVGSAAWAQEGILFFKAKKDGRDYQVTVTPQGEVFEMPMPPSFEPAGRRR
jgi:hypothetical protein